MTVFIIVRLGRGSNFRRSNSQAVACEFGRYSTALFRRFRRVGRYSSSGISSAYSRNELDLSAEYCAFIDDNLFQIILRAELSLTSNRC